MGRRAPLLLFWRSDGPRAPAPAENEAATYLEDLEPRLGTQGPDPEAARSAESSSTRLGWQGPRPAAAQSADWS
jgi:hypothetical protein